MTAQDTLHINHDVSFSIVLRKETTASKCSQHTVCEETVPKLSAITDHMIFLSKWGSSYTHHYTLTARHQAVDGQS